MALYEYECQKCKTIKEYTHKINEKIQERCVNCGAPPEELKKLLSAVKPHLSWSKWRV